MEKYKKANVSLCNKVRSVRCHCAKRVGVLKEMASGAGVERTSDTEPPLAACWVGCVEEALLVVSLPLPVPVLAVASVVAVMVVVVVVVVAASRGVSSLGLSAMVEVVCIPKRTVWFNSSKQVWFARLIR